MKPDRSGFLLRCRVILAHGMRHTQVHRNAQIGLVLARQGRKWGCAKERQLAERYYS